MPTRQQSVSAAAWRLSARGPSATSPSSARPEQSGLWRRKPASCTISHVSDRKINYVHSHTIHTAHGKALEMTDQLDWVWIWQSWPCTPLLGPRPSPTAWTRQKSRTSSRAKTCSRAVSRYLLCCHHLSPSCQMRICTLNSLICHWITDYFLCVTLGLDKKLSSICIITFSSHSPFSLPPTSNSTSQAILCDVPRLRYVIVVDNKPTSWPNVPRGIMVYNMDAVRDMGSKPDNSEYLCGVIKKVSNFVGEIEVHWWRLNTKPTPWCVIGVMCCAWPSQREVKSKHPLPRWHWSTFQENEGKQKLCLCYNYHLSHVYTFPLTVFDKENIEYYKILNTSNRIHNIHVKY